MAEERKGDDGWNEWKRHVLAEMERLGDGQEKMDDKLKVIHTDIATLKVKAGIWGAIAGFIPSAIAVIWMLVTS